MTKAELIKKVSEKTRLSNNLSENALKTLLEIITSELAQGNDVQISGFGKFTAKQRNARTGRNPRTGEALTIPACKAVMFVPSKALKDAVNK